MKRTTLGWLAVAGLVTAFTAVPAEAQQQRTQTFDLHPGWNAIYLEVVPTPSDSAAVFGTIPAPVLSVWSWSRKANPVQFIKDPAEGLSNLAGTGWLGWFPGNPATDPQAALTNLFAAQANRPYLIHLGGGGNVTWSVTGRPSAVDTEWVADSFNLTGLPVEEALAPTFAQYFAASPQHVGQPIYRLNGAGTWDLIPAGAQVKRGEAYWIFCAGGSSYTGPMQLGLEQGDGLEYGQTVVESTLKVKNLSASPITVRLKLYPDIGGGTVPLTYRAFGANGETSFPPLPPVLGVPAAPGEEISVLLGVRRADLTGEQADAVLEVTDGLGTRRLIPVHASRQGFPAVSLAAPQPPLASARLGRSATILGNAPLPAYAGLWLGTVDVKAVSQSQVVDISTCPADPNDPCFPQVGSLATTPVKQEFSFRIMVHVDENGQARLLKEVIQMWKNGTPATSSTAEVPGHFVLVTDDALVPNFTGAQVRNGTPVGRRLSTAAYDFAGQYLPLVGAMSPSGNLTVSFEVPKRFPTNPYTHKFHPDHNNTVNGAPTEFESYDVLRSMELAFTSTDPTGRNSPEWGSSILGGTYREVFGVEYTPPDPITGLRQLVKGIHKNPIAVEGTFQLHRVSLTAQLNQ